jgi:hypothetical protein
MKKLERNEMKHLKGGVAPSCQYENPGSYESPVGGLTRAQAEGASNEMGGHWCCASCCSASWSNKTGCPQSPN